MFIAPSCEVTYGQPNIAIQHKTRKLKVKAQAAKPRIQRYREK